MATISASTLLSLFNTLTQSDGPAMPASKWLNLSLMDPQMQNPLRNRSHNVPGCSRGGECQRISQAQACLMMELTGLSSPASSCLVWHKDWIPHWLTQCAKPTISCFTVGFVSFYLHTDQSFPDASTNYQAFGLFIIVLPSLWVFIQMVWMFKLLNAWPWHQYEADLYIGV